MYRHTYTYTYINIKSDQCVYNYIGTYVCMPMHIFVFVSSIKKKKEKTIVERNTCHQVDK